MIDGLLVADVYVLMMIFARIGTAMMLLPGFGELTLPVRVRLALALTVTFVVAPLVAGAIPPVPANLPSLVILLIAEILYGAVLGTIARLLLTALQVGGTIIDYHMGLGAAMLFDPNAGQQGAVTGAFLTTLGVTLLFITNMHHLMLMAVVDSYTLFEPGGGFPTGDFSELAARTVSQSFALGFQIALPIVVVGILIYLAMGLMSRLMPQIQVFFIALPVQMLVGFTILAVTVGVGMLLFLEEFETAMIRFLEP